MEIELDSSTWLVVWDRSVWAESLTKYLEETETDCLDLNCCKIGTEEIKLALKLVICKPQITKLRLDECYLKDLTGFSKFLAKTQVKILKFTNCSLSDREFWLLIDSCGNNQITKFDFENDDYHVYELSEFISILPRSYLTKFYSAALIYPDDFPLLFQILPRTFLTHLDISITDLDEDILISLFSNLHQTSITHLNLSETLRCSGSRVLKKLSQNLRLSKVQKLDLGWNNLDDEQIDILADGLVHSKVRKLNLSRNHIQGNTVLGYRLKDTCITHLDLSENTIVYHGIFLCSDFLRYSSLNSLLLMSCDLNGKLGQKLLEGLKFSKIFWIHFGCCKLQLPFISNFAEVVKYTDLELVDFAKNNLSLDALITLGECLKGSKIKTVVLKDCFKYPNGGILLPSFLEKANALPAPVKYDHNYCRPPERKLSVAGPKFAHRLYCLDLASNELGIGVVNLLEHLKFTFFTRLFLYDNQITDEGVTALARVLHETCLIDLCLSDNQITSCGAKTLAVALKNSTLLRLRLRGNKIEDDGMEALARGAENTFVTELSLSSNPGNRQLLVDAVLWNNKTAVYHFVKAFKVIAPRSHEEQTFCFNVDLGNQDVSQFLETCLQMYKTFCEKPSAVSVLLEDRSLYFSREEIVFLMSEAFPSQFSFFVANQIEASIEQQVNLLKRTEEMGLNAIVEFLLLNRHLYYIDEHLEILHPYIYTLLFKYNYPLYNLDIEPHSKIKIINYFSEHKEIDGACNVIHLLQGK